MKTSVPLERKIFILEQLIEAISYDHDVKMLFGLDYDEALIVDLISEYEKCQISLIANPASSVPVANIIALESYLEVAKKLKLLWKNGPSPIRIICSDPELKDLVSEFLTTKKSLFYNKKDVEKLFDFTSSLPYWNQIPDYTLFIVDPQIRTQKQGWLRYTESHDSQIYS